MRGGTAGLHDARAGDEAQPRTHACVSLTSCAPARSPPPLAPPPPSSQIVGPIQVARRSDMDMNGHINNVTYVAWTLETVPRSVYERNHLYQVGGCCG